MRTLGRRMTKRAKKFRVAGKKRNKRHVSHTFQFRGDDSGRIDLEVGRTKSTNYRPRGHMCNIPTTTSRDYKPPDYKPSWDPKEPCVMCLEEGGLRYMPVLFKNEESGLLETWHYECLQAWLDARRWIEKYEAEELLLEEVAV